MRAQLIAFLDDAVARENLAIADTALAADQFAALYKARVFLWALLGDEILSEAEIITVADEAVQTFLARYAAPAERCRSRGRSGRRGCLRVARHRVGVQLRRP